MKVAVCIITFKRANGLRRLLEGIGALTFRDERPDICAVVVDNDEAGSGRETCDAIRPKLDCELKYYIEPRRGIPFARNTAVARAGDDADCIAFIDDDEVPDPRWLDELLHVMKEYQADVVAGPVLTHFVREPPEWVIRGKFYIRPRRETGQVLDRAFTGNILFRREVLTGMEALFDERMALTGGSDSHFLQRVHRAGFKIVWADDALATEWVPPSRVGAKWVFQRGYRFGTTMAFVYRDLHSVVATTIVLLVMGGYRIARGVLLLPFGLLGGRHHVVKHIRQICVGVGLFVGLAGGRYREYKKTHGV